MDSKNRRTGKDITHWGSWDTVYIGHIANILTLDAYFQMQYNTLLYTQRKELTTTRSISVNQVCYPA